MAREFRSEALGEADDAAFACAVVRVKGFAALPGSGTDGNDLAGLLLDHVRDGEMNDRVHALEVDANNVVPLLFGHFLDGEIFEVPDAGVGDENVQTAEPRDGVFDELLIFGVLT